MPPSHSDIRLLPCDFRYLDHCVQAMAKAYVDNITGSDDSKKFMRGYLNWGYLWLGTQIVYLDGWDGLGASSVLRAIAKSLASKEEMWNVEWIRLCNPVLIHIDCSTWQSIRVVQREVAEQLNLPSWVMEKFDRQDEEDDFDGVDQGSRAEINDVKSEICRSVFDRGFFLVLHNGGNKEISLANLGLLSNFSCTVFWTFRGRFRVDPKLIDNVVWIRNKVATYHEYYYCYQQDSDNSDLLLHAEAEEVAQKHGINPAVVVECVKYMLDRNHMSLHNINHDWALHASNYWICDGIIPQAQGIREPCAWLLGEALHQDMEFLIGYLSSHELSRQGCTDQVDLHHMRMSDEYRPYFISTKTCGFILNPDGIVPDKFQHSEQIRVLKLSRCTFRFASPPFLFCHSLRFLCLDHCRDQGVSSTDAKEEEEIITSWPCFQGLWVLDVRYTHWDEILSAHMLDLMTQLRELNVMGAQNWDMSHLHGQLSNIHKLRVTKSTCCNSEETAGQNLFLEMKRMELFEFSENHTTEGMKRLSGAARSTSLKTVIVGACVGLENISFRGCQELKDLFFTGLFAILEELDLSNTAIKFLDLKNVEAAHLKRLILLGCEKLRAILWPPKDKRAQYLEVLRIDNTQSASSSSPEKWEENIKEDSTCIGRSSSSAYAGGKEPLGSVQAASFDFNWYISMSDARLFRSIVPVEQYLQGKCVCIEMDSYPASNVVSGGIQFQGAHGIRNQTDHYSPYGKDGMVVEGHPHVVAASEGAIMTWACPPAPTLTAHDCYFHIQDEERKKKGRRLAPSLPALICNITNVLHFHNNLSITCFRVPPDTKWNCLEWCKVERCSELSFVFYTDQKSGDNTIFPRLRTFWASQLPEAYRIWTWNPRSMQPGKESFHCLEFLHLDCCPKLTSVLTSCEYMDTFPCLETLEIVCCGDLVEVFPCGWQRATIKKFSRLRHIHLHGLPMMQQICGPKIFAPVLETVKIRGCKSLRRLPAVTGNTKLPNVDCEKEWWQNLEWDGMQANHHPSLYKPSQSAN
uniref:Uncharacterized protein n=1 Tax=Avena sativa TaxID=4498 RepID=A0ACD6AKN4_AVESA